MKCKHCDSDNTNKNGHDPENGKQVYKCRDCGKTFRDSTKPSKAKPKVGMTLDQFRDKHDVEYIITKTLDSLASDLVYEKNDIIKLSGLSHGTPGMTAILESKSQYYGKIGGKVYFSHPKTIKDLKEQAKLN
jgi:hypothetical protein